MVNRKAGRRRGIGTRQRRQRSRANHRGERRRPGGPHRCAASNCAASGFAASPLDRGVPVELLTDDVDAAGVARRRRHRRRADGPRRARPQGDPGRSGAGQVGGDRQQGADGPVDRRVGPGRRERPRRPVLRGGRRRCHPRHPAADPVAGRRHRVARRGNRQRHDQLHPVGDGRDRGRLRLGAGRRQRARLRRSGSDRRRRGLRRRGQGRDPGVDRLPHPGHCRRRLPRGHHQGQLRPTSSRHGRCGCTIKLLAICERIINDEGQQRVSARVYPALVPLRSPAGIGQRSVQRGRGRGRGGRPADVLRPGCRRCSDGVRGDGGCRDGRPQPGAGWPWAPRVEVRRSCRSRRSGSSRRATT